MLNKVFVFLGLALIAILVIENMVTGQTSYFFVDSSASTGFTIFFSACIGVAIGYGLTGMLKGNKEEDDGLDF